MRVVRVFCSNRIKTNIMNIKYKNLRKRVFIIFVIFSLLYAELIITYTSPIGPMNSLAIFVDEKGNEIENAIGYFTITDRVHFLIKGQGRYCFKVLDIHGNVILSGSGKFNSSNYADLSFVLDQSRFKVGRKYTIEILAVDEPLPMLMRWGKVTKEFIISREITRLSIGFYRHPILNKTVVFAKLQDESNGISGRRVIFHYKHYGTNESFIYLGEGITNDEGIAEVLLNISDRKLLLIKAEFLGDYIYNPSAVDEIFSNEINISKLAIHRNAKSHNLIIRKIVNSEKKQIKNHVPKNDKTIRKTHVSLLSACTKIYSQNRDNKRIRTANKIPEIKFYDEDVKQLSLIEFLDNLTKKGSPASILVDVAEILNNLDDLPYVVWKLGIIFSKLNIALIPAVDGNGIIIYKVRVYEIIKNVAKTIRKTVTETVTQWVKKNRNCI